MDSLAEVKDFCQGYHMITIHKKQRHHRAQTYGPLVFHIARHRQQYPKRTLTQKELSQLSGVPQKQIEKLERTRELGRSLTNLVAIAEALNVAIDELIAPEIRADIASRILDRRRRLRLEIEDDCRSEW